MVKWTTCLVVGVVLLAGARASWLRGKHQKPSKHPSPMGAADVFRGSCAGLSKPATCWCGEDRRETIIEVKQCVYSTSWGSECEACQPAEELCQRLERCARCPLHNPNVVCDACPPDRYGLTCEKERPCKIPNVTEYTTVHPFVTKKDVYKLEFRCGGGRVRHGPRVLKCLQSGAWNKNPPQCVLPMRCSSLPSATPPFTQVKERVQSSEDRVVYECKAGYNHTNRVLETVMVCDNGAWVQVGESVQCEPSPTCTLQSSYLGVEPRNGSQVKSVYHAGESVEFECQDSFQLKESELESAADHEANFTLTCSGGHWVGTLPECELKGCPRLYVDHGDVSYHYSEDSNSSLPVPDFLPFHAVARTTCHRAHVLDGPQNLTCNHTGQWTPSAPQCVAKACDDAERGKMCSVPTTPTVLANTNKTEVYPGEIVSFRCSEYHFRPVKKKGELQRTCLHNGTLSGSPIQCTLASVCKIVAPEDDPHVRFCRGKGCSRRRRDDFRNRDFDMPGDVVSLFGTVEFFCDDDGLYCLHEDDKHSEFCLSARKDIVTPRCKPACGLSHLPKEALIMGGQARLIEARPWQAALLEVRGNQAEFTCGATLVHPQWAVTAAHCVTWENTTQAVYAKFMRVTYGLWSSSEAKKAARDDKEGKYAVKKIVIHKDYHTRSLDNDIALLQLTTPSALSRQVGLACLPPSDRHLTGGEKGVVTGWGRTESEPLSDGLRELDLTVVNASTCRKHYEDQGYNGVVVTEGMFCAMSNSTLHDATDGDSGGPFVRFVDSRWVLEGIVSWGAMDRRESKNPEVNRRAHVKLSKGPNLLPTCRGLACHGGYTRVSKYVDWIKEKTGGEVQASRCSRRYR